MKFFVFTLPEAAHLAVAPRFADVIDGGTRKTLAVSYSRPRPSKTFLFDHGNGTVVEILVTVEFGPVRIVHEASTLRMIGWLP